MFALTHLVGFAASDSEAAYSTTGVTFDGTNDYMTRGADLTSIANGKKGLASFWVKRNGTGIRQDMYFASAGLRFGFSGTDAGEAANDHVIVTGFNSTPTQILFMRSASPYTTSVWRHIAIAWDLSLGIGQLYVDGADARESGPTLTDDTIVYSHADHGICGTTSGARKQNADVADIYLNLAETLDLSVSSNLEKFRSTSGHPVDLGASGATPTGNQPIIFLKGPATAFNTNLGYGGDFSITGSLVDSATNP